jgi:hypothetical protein
LAAKIAAKFCKVGGWGIQCGGFEMISRSLCSDEETSHAIGART